MFKNGVEYILLDDGTLDVVFSVNGQIERFCPDMADDFRDEDGVLDVKAFVDYIEDIL